MKWPLSITLVRHAQSQYNALRRSKDNDERYKLFKKAFNRDPKSSECRELAQEMMEKYALSVSDYHTPLTFEGRNQAIFTGLKLKNVIPVPDIVIISPYLRACETFTYMATTWPIISEQKKVFDDRAREQEHGLALLYNDWRIFETFHPEQRDLRKLLGAYWYQYPQGESAAQVMDRVRSLTTTLIREYSELHVMIVTHHLTILSFRSNFERLTPEEFIRLDQEEKPINCGVTIYRGNPHMGKDGKLNLECYNRCFWDN